MKAKVFLESNQAVMTFTMSKQEAKYLFSLLDTTYVNDQSKKIPVDFGPLVAAAYDAQLYPENRCKWKLGD